MTPNHDLAEMAAALRAADRIAVTSHTNPDGDAVGSMLAVYHLLRAMGKSTITLVNEHPVPRIYQWLPGAELVRTSASMQGDLDADLVVIVDAATTVRIGTVADRIPQGAKLMVFDHHIEERSSGHWTFLDSGRSSVGEILFDLFAAASVPISADAAVCLYVSIATDTGGFRYSNTSPRSHRMAAALIECGIDIGDVSARVFETMSPAKSELLKRVLERMRREADGRLAYTMLTLKDMREASARGEDVDGLINFARNIEGVEVGILFRESDPQTTKVSFRSRPPFNCAEFLEPLGGGGHAAAAGVTLPMPLAAVRKLVLDRVHEVLRSES